MAPLAMEARADLELKSKQEAVLPVVRSRAWRRIKPEPTLRAQPTLLRQWVFALRLGALTPFTPGLTASRNLSSYFLVVFVHAKPGDELTTVRWFGCGE